MMQRLRRLSRGSLPIIVLLTILGLALIWWLDGVGLEPHQVIVEVKRVDLFHSPAAPDEKGRTLYRAQVELQNKTVSLQTPFPLAAGQQAVVHYTSGRFTGAIHVLRAIPAP